MHRRTFLAGVLTVIAPPIIGCKSTGIENLQPTIQLPVLSENSIEKIISFFTPHQYNAGQTLSTEIISNKQWTSLPVTSPVARKFRTGSLTYSTPMLFHQTTKQRGCPVL